MTIDTTKLRELALLARDAERWLSEEVQRFFMYTGRGRMVIREAVTEYLNDAYPLEALK